MNIKVTSDHIADGMEESSEFCPIALAIKEALSMNDDVIVEEWHIRIGDKLYDTPYGASCFINDFDDGGPGVVEPFEFNLDM